MSNRAERGKSNLSAYILAAGRGSRMYPFSQLISKPLLPIVNIPIILHSIEQLLIAGIHDISVVIKPEEYQIQSILETTYSNRNFDFIVQKEPLGTAHAVLQIEKYVEQDDFIVLAGDSLFSGDFLKKLSKIHRYENNSVTLALEEMEYELMRHSSTVEYHDGRVWNIREKPQTNADVLSNLNSAALYIFTQEIFEAIKVIKKSVRNEFELVSAIMRIIESNKRVGGGIAPRVFHITSAHDLWKTNLTFLRDVKNKDSNDNLIGMNVDSPSPDKIRNSVIGEHCSIHEGVTVQNSVILPKSVVIHDIKNSLVLSDHVVSFLSE
ncbi:MAG: sugar phosphate nucleotidyltransferase [Candidatus Hodarchaeales archaeon]|jgi:glucose-1-phosphate thymidylyltransferase